MKQLIGIIMLLFFVAIVSGPTKAYEIAQNLISGLGKVFVFIAECIVKVLPMIGVEDIIIAVLIFSGILMLASGVGIILSAKEKGKMWMTISTIVEIISTLTTIGSALALK